MPYEADVTGSNPLSLFPYVNMSKEEEEEEEEEDIVCKDSKLNTKLQTFNLDSSI
jgi:hypothetical protein